MMSNGVPNDIQKRQNNQSFSIYIYFAWFFISLIAKDNDIKN